MQRLIELLFKYKRFFLFAFLEFLCFILVVRNNPYQSASYYSSSNAVAGTIFSFTSSISGYFSLSSENDVLAEENALLRSQITELQEQLVSSELKALSVPDTNYHFIPAKVINNSIKKEHNYITLNRGISSGIKAGMGVISDGGVIGIITAVSQNYATVMSVLHTDFRVSAQLKDTHIIGSINWPGLTPKSAQLEFVPRHEKVLVGQHVVTSGYSSIFPEGIEIGTISKTELPSHASFHEITVDFKNDFNALNYVYVIDYKHLEEREKLESAPSPSEQ